MTTADVNVHFASTADFSVRMGRRSYNDVLNLEMALYNMVCHEGRLQPLPYYYPRHAEARSMRP
jgi:hypothetical protein